MKNCGYNMVNQNARKLLDLHEILYSAIFEADD